MLHDEESRGVRSSRESGSKRDEVAYFDQVEDGDRCTVAAKQLVKVEARGREEGINHVECDWRFASHLRVILAPEQGDASADLDERRKARVGSDLVGVGPVTGVKRRRERVRDNLLTFNIVGDITLLYQNT